MNRDIVKNSRLKRNHNKNYRYRKNSRKLLEIYTLLFKFERLTV